jgi:hypothetical protein
MGQIHARKAMDDILGLYAETYVSKYFVIWVVLSSLQILNRQSGLCMHGQRGSGTTYQNQCGKPLRKATKVVTNACIPME